MQSTIISIKTIVQRYRANRPQQYKRILKEITMEAIRLRILKVKELIVKGVKAKPKILVKEDI